MNFKYYIMILLAGMLISACKPNYHEKKRRENLKHRTYEKNLVKANKALVSRDSARIAGVARAHNWDMHVTGTGLWYHIIDSGTGDNAEPGQIAALDYHVKLLNGKLVYSADSTGLLKFKISKGGVERGLEEGILLLNEGDSARFIMPPYMAHHLLGDQKRIPPRTTIIYEVRLKSLKK